MAKKGKKSIKIPIRYLPLKLSSREKKKQTRMLLKSRKLYKEGKYFTRKKLSSYKSKKSKYLNEVEKIYHIDKVGVTDDLSKATGCSKDALSQIIKKGEGAYYSSGSRPNQTPKSWGLARLASAITAGKSAAVDYKIINKGCNHKKKTYKLALKSRAKYNYGHSKTRKISIKY